ncbi:MAG: PINc/VapC family ATPase [Candidatus Thermoplasmatota archaeon]|nr:PINc/VapC family ATPase [Candidatus Thermoplasmatota archaeon]
MKIVPDTSVVVDGRITSIVRHKERGAAEVIVPEAVVAELEAQADRGQETGYKGLEELGELAQLADSGHIALRYVGSRPTLDDIKLAGGGAIDAAIRSVAEEEGATLITSDWIQARVAEAKRIPVEYLRPKTKGKRPKPGLLKYFEPDVMSVHLKVNTLPRVKAGKPGQMVLKTVGKEKLGEQQVKRMAREILAEAKQHPKGFVEMDEGGATVVQLDDIRVAMAWPPFSDGLEITAVRPVAHVSLKEYKFAEIIQERLRDRYRGLLIAGPPGAGKSTLAQAVAEYLHEIGWIVKTMEKPRDLQVIDEITQYTALEGDMSRTADLLLLVRPDYTIYDELRKTADFQVFADMRLAGVGLVGVVHATRGIDAIQRLIGRVELGMIPQIVDTVLFVEDGAIRQFYNLRFSVKVPQGMIEADLARPVIEIVDFESGRTEFEIYTYGDQVVVMPVEEGAESSPLKSLAERQVAYELARFVNGPVHVKLEGESAATVYVPEREIAGVIGREGRHISEIERIIGIKLNIQPLKARNRKGQTRSEGKPAKVDMERRSVIVQAGGEFSGQHVEVRIAGQPLFQGTVGRDGLIRVAKGSEEGKTLQDAFFANKRVTVARLS